MSERHEADRQEHETDKNTRRTRHLAVLVLCGPHKLVVLGMAPSGQKKTLPLISYTRGGGDGGGGGGGGGSGGGGVVAGGCLFTPRTHIKQA